MTSRQFRSAILILLGLAAALVWLGRSTNVDLVLADAVFDFSANEFPWRSHWFFENVMHHAMRALMIGTGLVPVAALLADRLGGRALFDDKARKRLIVVVASAALVPLAISTMKGFSIHHCPWNLSRYGGYAPFLRIFDGLPAGGSAGHCFPAGHASSALWMASFAVYWLPEKPAKAIAVFLAGLIPGFTLGLAQQVRGAHFLTHTLWSMWIAALIVVLLSALLFGSASSPIEASPVQIGR